MIYVMSDLHGMADKYFAMLQKIGFSDEDDLYVLGDVVDRGEKPMAILKDMSMRPNVFPIMGNHDKMALDVLRRLMVEITPETIQNHLTPETLRSASIWMRNGAQTTLDDFKRLSADEREAILDYLEEFAPYEVVQAGGRTFILVHAGLGGFRPDRPLDDYDIFELAFDRMNYDTPLFDGDVYLATGHTPTFVLTGKPESYHSQHNIDIDCGAVFAQGRLACLCLDTMEEFYI